MEFSDKLTALMMLTATKGSELAEALDLGRPYVSRLKTGERKMPSDLRVVRSMASFFAARCGEEYRLRALYGYTADQRLSHYTSETMTAEAIYDWLAERRQLTKSPADRFLSHFEMYSQPGFSPDGTAITGQPPQKSGIEAYYKNEGKRQALRNMVAYVESLEKPCTVRIFTDEVYDWLVEDAAFSEWLNGILSRQAVNGITFERIQPPFNSAEFNFSIIERWLPGYMAGAVQQYHYPWARDKLHRRTLFVVPGRIALWSNSVYGEHEAPVTMLTRNPDMVNICDEEYSALMERCRPTTSTFSANSERLFVEAEAVAAINDTGVYKTSRLSVNTLPPAITGRIYRHGTPFARRMAESFNRRGQARAEVLLHHTITDIMCLPLLDNVLAGREPIPGTSAMPDGALYYTPEEYGQHLRHILWYLETFPCYQALLIDDVLLSNVVLYVKGDSRALLVRQTQPFSVLDITEHTMAAAFCDYLRNMVEANMTAGTRQQTVRKLEEELRRLEAAVGRL